ncbi:MAG: 1,4-alpha-glucan-branching enzyme [Chlorobi bacterium]|nr:1,4-alpha-glucan-branching enzyme [Chlorobiota bacterium]
MKLPDYLIHDPWLEPFTNAILRRKEYFLYRREQILAGKDPVDFANGHLFFGLHFEKGKWIIREWAPNATGISIVGDMTGWKQDNQFRLSPAGNGIWEAILPSGKVKHGQLYKLLVQWDGGSGERIPAYASRVVQDEKTKLFSAQVWQPAKAYRWKVPKFNRPDEAPLIYEAHIGMSSEAEKVSTFREFRENILPRIKTLGYNTLQLMAIQEHPFYGSFGYHVSSFFAVSSRFGTPDDLKELIDQAHAMDIAVIMDIVHSHAVKNVNEGLGLFDGTRYQYFHDGPMGEHPAWDSYCFNYSKPEIVHFLLSNCKYWLDTFHFDGFRFDGITSMLYLDHGLSRDFTSYNDYYDGNQDEDAIVYLKLANELIHQIKPTALSIAEEMSGMPGLATPFTGGGYGFDYRLAMGTPDFWIKTIKEKADEEWNVSTIYYELSNHRSDEQTIGYTESHDQALVGDKTIAFRLMDKEMYFHMQRSDENLVIDRGMALHKMIRLVTAATAGGGYLNFMGNEFGHPEWIDFPREGNNWSFKYARRQWSLADNPDLRYGDLLLFDRDMVTLLKESSVYKTPFPELVVSHETDQVLAFRRKNWLFVFNFSPVRSYTDYGLFVPGGKYIIKLNTDNTLYGGFDRIDTELTYQTVTDTHGTSVLKLYVPSRTGLVLQRITTC